jgi:hypothetical protein
MVPTTTWNPVGKLNVAVTAVARIVFVVESNSRELTVPVACPYWVELVKRWFGDPVTGTAVPKILRSVTDDSAVCRPAQSTRVALLAPASARTHGELASGRLKMQTSDRLDEAVAV